MKTQPLITSIVLFGTLAISAALAQEYKFKGGYPTSEATREARDDTDFQRAMTAYRFWYPTVSCEGIFSGQRDLGLKDNQDFMVMACGPRHVIFTGNSDTPYGGAKADLTDGPIVVELPPGPFISLAMDHHQRWILDMGLSGPDAGKGGKHLILPPGYKEKIPDGYNVGRSSSLKISIAMRALPQKGDVKGALDAIRRVKVYPLSTAANPALFRFVDLSDKKADLTSLRWEDNLAYWEKLHAVIDAEPVVEEFRPMYGLLAAIGIEKGKPFAPDARMKGILEKAARAGRDQMVVSAFDSSRADRIVWNDRKWEWAALAYEGSDFETKSGLDLEARDRWFAQAIGMSPKMLLRSQGAGSLYWLANRSKDGAFLEGSKTYKLTVPEPVPANLFWSVTVYDAETRSQIQTDQDKAALRSMFELKGVSGGLAELYFGPKAPAGSEDRWIKTIPGKGWFAYLRIYGPEQPAFDGSWKPGDFESLTPEAVGAPGSSTSEQRGRKPKVE
jgi:hypothetical protein